MTPIKKYFKNYTLMNYSRSKAFNYIGFALILMNITMGIWNWYTDGFRESLFNISCAIWLFMIYHLLNHVNSLMKLISDRNAEIERLNAEITKRDVDVADFKRAMRI